MKPSVVIIVEADSSRAGGEGRHSAWPHIKPYQWAQGQKMKWTEAIHYFSRFALNVGKLVSRPRTGHSWDCQRPRLDTCLPSHWLSGLYFTPPPGRCYWWSPPPASPSPTLVQQPAEHRFNDWGLRKLVLVFHVSELWLGNMAWRI